MNGSLMWIGYKTIVRKEITRILRIWGQTIVPPAITMTLYFIIFGELIGRRIGEMGGFSYMQFIVPGLVIGLLAGLFCATAPASAQDIEGRIEAFQRAEHLVAIAALHVLTPVPGCLVIGGPGVARTEQVADVPG